MAACANVFVPITASVRLETIPSSTLWPISMNFSFN